MRSILSFVLSKIIIVGVSAFSTVAIADERQTGIQNVITRQLEAFRRSDADTAWSIAAPSIQMRFGTRENFMHMVENYYPQIMNSKSAIFKDLREIDGTLVQRVFVEGGPGDFVDAYYSMKLINGAWRITGVYIAKPKPAGA